MESPSYHCGKARGNLTLEDCGGRDFVAPAGSQRFCAALFGRQI
jgi:hypothetical protein